MAKHLTTALVQLNVSDRPLENLSTTQAFIQSAADQGAELIATPECTNFIAANARDLAANLHLEGDDPTLLAIRAQAKALGVWILIGSLCLKNDTGTDAMAVNRQFFITPKGEIIGRYDKVHMFDVDVADGQTYRESAQYAAGNHLQTSRLQDLTLGHSICYDVRFPYLYSGLAKRGLESSLCPLLSLMSRAKPTGRHCYARAPLKQAVGSSPQHNAVCMRAGGAHGAIA